MLNYKRCISYVEHKLMHSHKYCVLFLAYKHLAKLHDDNQYIIEGVYFNENQTPWTITDVVRMKKGFIAELQHQLLARAPVCVRVSGRCCEPAVSGVRHWTCNGCARLSAPTVRL